MTESCLEGLTVVIPCYKEDSEAVTETHAQLISLGAEVIVVDDGDTMDLDFAHLSHQPNMGYGYALKRGISMAKNDIILTMDGDGQHTISDAIRLYMTFKIIEDCAMLVGSRWNLSETWYRKWFRKLLNFIASIIAGHYLVDLNSGMRVFKTDLARGYRPILCDTFSFTTSLSMAMIADGHKVAYFPIDVQPRNFGKSRVRLLKDGLVTLYYILWVGIALRTRKLRAWLSGR